MSISVRIFEFRMGIGIEKSDKFQFIDLFGITNFIIINSALPLTFIATSPGTSSAYVFWTRLVQSRRTMSRSAWMLRTITGSRIRKRVNEYER